MIGIGDFDGKARNSRKVCTRQGQLMYMGKKYAQDKTTGYYVCTSGDRKRLHVAMWEHERGMAVPPGYVIHHKDFDKTHNEMSNFMCITVAEHEAIHNSKSDGTNKWGIDIDKIVGI